MPFGHATERKCTGHCKDGRPCGQPAMRGKTVCKMHGGLSKSGMANGNYRTGKYSRVLPVRLQQSYEEATHNPQLLSVRHDLAACEAMIQEAFARFDSGESGAAWRALQAALAAFEAAERRGDDAVMVAHLATMRALIRRGTREQAIIEDICTLWH